MLWGRGAILYTIIHLGDMFLPLSGFAIVQVQKVLFWILCIQGKNEEKRVTTAMGCFRVILNVLHITLPISHLLKLVTWFQTTAKEAGQYSLVLCQGKGHMTLFGERERWLDKCLSHRWLMI